MVKQKRGADVVVEALVTAGVDTIFTLSGNQIMPVFDACIDAGIRLVHVRHEAAAVFMADAWAQLNNNIGVAMLTAAPGFTNGLAPLYSATCAESPVLLLSGDSPLSQDGMGAFQEMDQVSIAAPLTKSSKRLTRLEAIKSDLFAAINTARSARPGPVHIALPFDLLNQCITDSAIEKADGFEPQTEVPSTALIEQLRLLLAQADRPVILTGPSLSPSRNANLHEQIVASSGAPVISMESPRGLRDPALGNICRVLNEADLIVCLGKKIDFTLNFGEPSAFHSDCKFVVIDSDNDVLKQARRALEDRLILVESGNPLGVAHCLCAFSETNTSARNDWLHSVTGEISARPEQPTQREEANLIQPVTLCHIVHRVLSAQSSPLLICDGGEFGQWAQAYISAPTRIINGISGAIGGSICYAIAAKISRPQATVFALMGDGTSGFHLAEFETAIRNKTPFVAIIGNDARWNAEVQIQLRDYGADRLIACELEPLRYDQVVAAMGGYGEYIDDSTQLEMALQRAIDSGLPACINVQIEGLAAPSGSGH